MKARYVSESIDWLKFFKKMDRNSPYFEKSGDSFEKTGDPLKDMKLGMKARISQWLDMMDVERYRINDDLTIDVAKDVNLVGQELEELPEFINFNKIWGGFYAGGNPWQSLRGFPKAVYGDLQINSISNLMNPEDMNPDITEEYVKKLIEVHGEIFV